MGKNSSFASLSPSQQAAYDWFTKAVPLGNIFHFWCRPGRGRSTTLREIHRALGGKLLTLQDFVTASTTVHPLALEDALYKILYKSLQRHNVVIVDDFHVATEAMGGDCHMYPRSGFLDSPLNVIAAIAVDAGKKLFIGTDGRLAQPFRDRCFAYGIDGLSPEDYQFLCAHFASSSFAKQIDFAKVHRFAPQLNAHQLKAACAWCATDNAMDTELFIEYLRSQQLISNVQLGEVTDVRLNELKGVDDVIRSLEANIVMPLENDELASEFDIKPKRGVLLVGPPGTGKTTVGRALAHRLKGKFFLIDGTFISGTRDFYGMIHRIFQSAMENAPSVIFIDDSDVIFESGQEHGLYRYLLTMLDGLESKRVGRVCVVLTAMDVGNLPPALVRSGRIELWLEMKYPDESARKEILQQYVPRLPPPLNEVCTVTVAQLTDQFSGADIKRVVEDSKTMYAFDKVQGIPMKDSICYFQSAADIVRASKEKYALAESRANASRQSRPSWFNPDLHLEYYRGVDDQ